MRGGEIAGGRPPREAVPDSREVVPGTYLYGGFMHPHFGHMIAEFMHRLWPLERPEFQGVRPVFVDMLDRKGEKFLRNVLSLMRLPEPLIVDRPMEFERLVVGEVGKMHRGTAVPGYADFLERRLGYLRTTGKRHPTRLAVLRGHIRRPRCLGERWLERELVRAGYVAFHPEDYPLAGRALPGRGEDHLLRRQCDPPDGYHAGDQGGHRGAEPEAAGTARPTYAGRQVCQPESV